ncbi:unnamed protein product [Paramecium primaurelia]|uniref:Transmembrane protein n=1 Tax=Paramecium primaurelia TaxID=5886 RepID=A0A8S1QET1_PARPR|nr:unnamed protein product [Paramecium primaurelia]
MNGVSCIIVQGKIVSIQLLKIQLLVRIIFMLMMIVMINLETRQKQKQNLFSNDYHSSLEIDILAQIKLMINSSGNIYVKSKSKKLDVVKELFCFQ